MILMLTIIFTIILLLYVQSKRYQKVDWGSRLINFVDGLMRWYCLRFHRLKMENVPRLEAGASIICANHYSGLDPFLLLSCLERPVHFLIAKEEYERPYLNWLFRKSGCIPVDRKAKSIFQFRHAKKVLDEGGIIGIFPQGSIHLPEEGFRPLKSGAYKLAAMAATNIHWFHLDGMKSKGSTFACLYQRGNTQVSYKMTIDPLVTSESEWRTEIANKLIYNKQKP
jgi:1-acyl-sn-glycerol-3-phosphate acyltransferase